MKIHFKKGGEFKMFGLKTNNGMTMFGNKTNHSPNMPAFNVNEKLAQMASNKSKLEK